jgi:hypothetical protein
MDDRESELRLLLRQQLYATLHEQQAGDVYTATLTIAWPSMIRIQADGATACEALAALAQRRGLVRNPADPTPSIPPDRRKTGPCGHGREHELTDGPPVRDYWRAIYGP